MQACDATAMQALNFNAFATIQDLIDLVGHVCQGGSVKGYSGNDAAALPFQDVNGDCFGAASNSAATCQASVSGATRLCACS